jgi:outer membrane protein assembly factor BamA
MKKKRLEANQWSSRCAVLILPTANFVWSKLLKNLLKNNLLQWFCRMSCILVGLTGAAHAQIWEARLGGLPDTLVLAANDSARLSALLTQWLDQQRHSGYWAVSIDSLHKQGKRWQGTVYLGQRYEKVWIRRGNLPESVALSVGWPREGMAVKIDEWTILVKKILQVTENEGYPFASVQLNNLTLANGGWYANLLYQEGTRVKFDSLKLLGSVDIKTRFLYRYLGWQVGSWYSTDKIRWAVSQLSNFPYVVISREPEIFVERDRAGIYIYAEKRKSGRFDGLIGVMPNETSNGRMLLTGQVQLQLDNLLSSGKQLLFEWQRVRAASQLLKAEYSHPLIIRNFDVNIYADFLKEDSTFYNFRRGGYAFYRLGTYNKIGFGSELRTSSVSDTLQIRQRQLSPTRWWTYRLRYEHKHLSDPLAPKRGRQLKLEMALGNKKTILAADSLANSSQLQTSVQIYGQQFFPLGLKSTLLLQLNGGFLWGDNLYRNELFRLGGLRTLRGFNENTFFAQSYAVINIEPRLYSGGGSYLYLFTDVAYIQQKESFIEWPIGFGAGISLAMKNGIFNFAYALGKSNTQNFSPARAKVHIGFSSTL